jgi:hypothetical protein
MPPATPARPDAGPSRRAFSGEYGFGGVIAALPGFVVIGDARKLRGWP